MSRIAVFIILNDGARTPGWLECRDHGMDLRFFWLNGHRVNESRIQSWDLRKQEKEG